MKRTIGVLLAALLMLTGFALAEDYEIFEGDRTALDLNGDGAAEEVSWRMVDLEEEGQVELTVGAAVWESGWLWCAQVYACDMNADGSVELFVSGDEMSSDFVTYCLRYVDGTLVPLTFPDVNRGENTDGRFDYGYGMVVELDDQRVTLCGSQDVLGTYFGTRVLELDGDQFVLADDGLWRFEWDFEDDDVWEICGLTLVQDVKAVLEDGSEIVLNPGEQLLITASDKVSVAYFRTRDGREGHFAIAPDEERGWGMKVNGVSEDELFEFVPYAD